MFRSSSMVSTIVMSDIGTVVCHPLYIGRAAPLGKVTNRNHQQDVV